MFLFLATVSGAADPGGIWSSIITKLSPDSSGNYAIFPNMPSIVSQSRQPFVLISGALLIASFVIDANKASRPEEWLRPFVKVALLCACIAFVAPIMTGATSAVEDLRTNYFKTASSPTEIVANMDKVLLDFADMQNGAPTNASNNPLTKALDSVTQGLQSLGVSLVVGIVSIFFKLAELVALLYTCFQYFILQLSSIFMPTMIGMLGIGALSGIGTKYIMSVVGVIAWPLAWGLGNIGTEVFIQSLDKVGMQASMDLMSYIWVGVCLLVIPVWVTVVYVCGPLLIAKMMTSGSNIAQALAAGAAAGTIGVGGASAAGAGVAVGAAAKNSLGGMKSMRLAPLEGGGPTPGGSAGGATSAGGGGPKPNAGNGGAKGVGSVGGKEVDGTGLSDTAKNGESGPGIVGPEKSTGGTPPVGGSSTAGKGSSNPGTGAGAMGLAALDAAAKGAAQHTLSAVAAAQSPLIDMAENEGLSESQIIARRSIAKRKP